MLPPASATRLLQCARRDATLELSPLPPLSIFLAILFPQRRGYYAQPIPLESVSPRARGGNRGGQNSGDAIYLPQIEGASRDSNSGSSRGAAFLSELGL